MKKNKKFYTEQDVLKAAHKRLDWIFDEFDNICISFSGGKDSTVLYHLASEIARSKGKCFSVLFIDWEVQYNYTINHVKKMKLLYADVTKNFYWIALPLKTVNGVSQCSPEWICWERNIKWVRTPPQDAISDTNFFPFYYYGMTFEEFIPAFSSWFSIQGRASIILTGIRADESLTRYIGVVSSRKLRYDDDKPWTTASPDGFYYTGNPLYDWKIQDIWKYHSITHHIFNPIYELMYRAGVPFKSMRVCEPFGPEQRKGLWLYHIIEPQTWNKICYRVAGSHNGAIYANESGDFYALRKSITKPENHTWNSYALSLLSAMPEYTSEHYKIKISIYIHWYKSHGYPEGIPDYQHNDLGYVDIPSWRRICKTILKNDFWCRTLSFSPTRTKNYKKYMERMKKKRKEWGIL